MSSLTQRTNDKLMSQYSNIHIGKYSRIWGTIDCIYPRVNIGSCVVFGGGSRIITHCPILCMEKDTIETTIGHDTWIGYQCIILPDIKIGPRSLIGAGSVVTKDIPSDSIYAGNPARFIRTRDDIEIVRTHLTTKQGLPSGKPGIEPNWKLLTVSELHSIFDSKSRGDNVYKKLVELKYI